MALTAKNLTVAYHDHAIIDQLNFDLVAGQLTLLMGPSGSGKSTLLKTLAGLFPQYGGQVSGEVTIDEADVLAMPAHDRAKKVALLFQNPDDQFAMPTVREEFIFALENLELSPSEIDDKIAWSLAKVGLTDFIDRAFVTLSGGELQKVALAEILALGADFLLLDEPFAAIDQQSRVDLQVLLKQLSQEGYGIVVADHDPAGYFDKITAFYQVVDGALALVAKADWSQYDYQKQTVIVTASQQDSMPLYRMDNLRIQNGERLVLNQDVLSLYEGQLTLITGPNGVGKSSLFKTMAHLHDYQGSLVYQDKEVSNWKKRRYYQEVGLLFQSASEQFINITVEEELNQVRKNSRQQDYWTEDRVSAWLTDLNLTGLSDRSVYTLSGGQQKKLQLLLMLIIAPKVLFLDEPLAGLDEASVAVVLRLIKETQVTLGLTVMVVSHQTRDLVKIVDQHIAYQGTALAYQQEVLV
ncbi:ABC-type cobalt transport system, ATPase component [Fructobacillus pseudoficulneus]|uniref:ABC-type cobalt transport system, ATPase component n=1 Tax=Fructobacillus pseudoficulneus TaxID=220714 RepID=A0A3F3H6Z4_9LACO|nr:ABC transporter ATP-binding protein [Fructobacillus pseudoficulneus]GAP02579.1 ABC-type cobalt transport system, ATPase component [Fructobacillus pseudoficulneus]SEH38325.1 energy-coupling factor transport system ATP-binding protein [Fructobacillus pseudoficulneus]